MGHLQSNKARAAVQAFDMLHGLDSPELLAAWTARPASWTRAPGVFLQVNVERRAQQARPPPAALPAALEAGRRDTRGCWD